MLRDWQAFRDLAKRFAEGDVCLRVGGLAGSARALAVAELLQTHPRPVLVVVASLADAHRFAQDLKFFGASAFEFPEREPQLWKGGHHREAEAERAMIVRSLTAGEPIAVVVTPAALDTPLPAPGAFREGTLRLATRDSLDRELLLEALEKAGYERVDTVVEVGQWSARGGIVDVFSPVHPSPARLEFDGDDIESIRLFDPTTQRSTGTLDELLVLPLVAVPDTADDSATRLLQYLPAGAPVIVDAPRLLDETSEDAPGRRPLAQIIAGRPRVELEILAGEDGDVTLEAMSVEPYSGKFDRLVEDVNRCAARASPSASSPRTPARPSICARSCTTTASTCRWSTRSRRRTPSRSSSASCRAVSPSPRWGSSCSPRPRSSARGGGRCGGRSTSAAPR